MSRGTGPSDGEGYNHASVAGPHIALTTNLVPTIGGPDPGVVVDRVADEPVVAPGSVEGYGPIFNAGVLHHDGRYHLFARGVRNGYRENHGPGPRFLGNLGRVHEQLADMLARGADLELLSLPRYSRRN